VVSEPIRATPGSTDGLILSSGREETMASWQIKGLLVLGAALAATTLAASASAAQVAPDQLSCAMIAGGSDGGFPTGRVFDMLPEAGAAG
jgi:hypothetical protein